MKEDTKDGRQEEKVAITHSPGSVCNQASGPIRRSLAQISKADVIFMPHMHASTPLTCTQ